MVLIVCATAAPVGAIEYRFQTIALSEAIAPGAGGESFATFTTPTINNRGDVAFQGTLEDQRRGLFVAGVDGLRAVALPGDVAPGSGGGGAEQPFVRIISVVLNDAGEVAFNAATSPNIRDGESGIFATVGGALQAVAFEHDPLPDDGSGEQRRYSGFSGVIGPSLNDSGEIAFLGGFESDTQNFRASIFRSGASGVELLAEQGQQLPGVGQQPNSFVGSLSRPAINNQGVVAAEAGDGLLTAEGGSLTLSRIGSGRVILETLNDVGQSLVLTDRGRSEVALRVANGDQSEIVAAFGQVAPGSGVGGDDTTFQDFRPFRRAADLNEAGEVAFTAFTQPNAGGRQSGIFTSAGGSLQTVAFEGQIAPGSGGNGDDVEFSFFQSPDINAAGDVAFAAMTEANADGGARGIFVSADGALEKVLFEGDAFEVGPGDTRTIRNDFGLQTWESGYVRQSLDRNRGFNDRGQIAFLARFTDGSSGIFIATPVPNPTGVVVLIVGLVGLLCGRSWFCGHSGAGVL